MSLPSRFAAVAAFLVLTLAGVPWFITASGRSDLYYTLTSGALLSIASGGVWLTFYIVAVILMVLCFAALYRLVHSRIGRLCLSLQQNEELASSIGVNIAHLRVIIYAISSFLGGIGGAMFMAISQSIYPSSFTVTDS